MGMAKPLRKGQLAYIEWPGNCIQLWVQVQIDSTSLASTSLAVFLQ